MIVDKDVVVAPVAVLVDSLEVLGCVGLRVGLIASEVFDSGASLIAL